MGGDTGSGKSSSSTVGMSFGNSVGTYSRDAFRTILARQTVTKVRAALAAGQIPAANVVHAHEWIAEQEAPREAEKEFTDTAYRERAVLAAEKSADAAVWSARYAAVAIVISLVALGFSIYSLFKK